MHHEDEQILESHIVLAFGANVKGEAGQLAGGVYPRNAKLAYENPGDARPAGASATARRHKRSRRATFLLSPERRGVVSSVPPRCHASIKS